MNIFLYQGGQQIGPYSTEEIQRRIASGRLAPTDLAWKEGLPEWVTVETLVPVMPVAPPNVPVRKAVVSAVPRESQEGINWGQIIRGIFVALVVGNLVFVNMCSSSSDKPTTISEGSPSEAFEKESNVSLEDFSVTWITTARGLTAVDGRLWVPQVKTTVRNNGSSDLDNYVLRAVFFDDKGVITSESKEWIRDLPAGYAKGPFFINGSVGYTSDMSFMGMVKDDTKKWRYDIFTSLSYSGPWKKIKSDYVPVPAEYERLFKE